MLVASSNLCCLRTRAKGCCVGWTVKYGKQAGTVLWVVVTAAMSVGVEPQSVSRHLPDPLHTAGSHQSKVGSLLLWAPSTGTQDLAGSQGKVTRLWGMLQPMPTLLLEDLKSRALAQDRHGCWLPETVEARCMPHWPTSHF